MNRDKVINLKNVHSIKSVNFSGSSLTLTLHGTRTDDVIGSATIVVIHLEIWQIPRIISELVETAKAKYETVKVELQKCREAAQ